VPFQFRFALRSGSESLTEGRADLLQKLRPASGRLSGTVFPSHCPDQHIGAGLQDNPCDKPLMLHLDPSSPEELAFALSKAVKQSDSALRGFMFAEKKKGRPPTAQMHFGEVPRLLTHL